MSLPISSPLKAAALQPKTHKTYNTNLTTFLQFSNISFVSLIRLSIFQIDSLFSTYLDHSYLHGGSYSKASQALNGLCFQLPHLRGWMKESSLRLKGWKKLSPSISHPPITWELTVLLSVVSAKSGYYSEAIGMLLSFHCYLRVSELVSIRFKDVAIPNDPRLGVAHRQMALRLGKAKTGVNQWVSIQHPQIATLFYSYLTKRHYRSKELVFPFSSAHFRRHVHSAVLSIGLRSTPYVPHSFRHGGATSDFLKNGSIQEVMFRGRWKATSSASNYIQQGRALLLRRNIPQYLNDDGHLFSLHLVEILMHLGGSAV